MPQYDILSPARCSGFPYLGTRAADSALARTGECFNLNHYYLILSLPNKYYGNPPTRRKYSFQHLGTPWNMRLPAAHMPAPTKRALPDCPEPAPSAKCDVSKLSVQKCAFFYLLDTGLERNSFQRTILKTLPSDVFNPVPNINTF